MSLKNEQNKLNKESCSLSFDLNDSSKISSLFEILKNSDPVLSAIIENQLVDLGKFQIDQIVKGLASSNSIIKKHAAMTLIRIGPDSIAPLVNEYSNKKELCWMIDFIVGEITCQASNS